MRDAARFTSCAVAGLVAMGLSAPAAAGEAKVEKGELLITFERHARVEPAIKRPVRYEPEVFGGRLQLAARARPAGPVNAGDTLIELFAKDFDEQYEDAKTLAAEAERRLDIQR